MSDILAQAHDQLPGSDRRSAMRHPIRSLAYVELDEGNGGIILNIGEGGMSVQAVTSLMDDFLPEVRFQLAETESWIEAKARITWTSESRKLAGLEFIGLSAESQNRIREWLSRETFADVVTQGVDDAPTEEASAPTPDAATPAADASDIATPPPAAEPAVADEFPTPAHQPVNEPSETAFVQPKLDSAPSPLVDLLASVSERMNRPGALPNSTAPLEPSATKRSGIDKLIENNWSAVTVLLFLALASLLAGWAAGQGGLGRYLSRIHLSPSRDSAVARAPESSPLVSPAHLAEIEVVSANNQRWTIPFDGPVSPAPVVNHTQISSSDSYPPEPKADPGFHTWIVTPPSPRSSAEARSTNVAPPVLPEAPSPGDNVLTASGALNSRALAGAANSLVPAPPAATGVIKQGQLIRRVDPVYPAIAKEQHAEGTVRLNVTVGPDGVVRGISVLGGPRLLIDAAEMAVRQWRYSPTLLDGKPVEFQREVDLTFRIAN
jgi:TonB family protein